MINLNVSTHSNQRSFSFEQQPSIKCTGLVHRLWVLGWHEELQDRRKKAAVFLTRNENLEALLKLLLLEFSDHLKMN
jgi:hypothetical protein